MFLSLRLWLDKQTLKKLKQEALVETVVNSMSLALQVSLSCFAMNTMNQTWNGVIMLNVAGTATMGLNMLEMPLSRSIQRLTALEPPLWKVLQYLSSVALPDLDKIRTTTVGPSSSSVLSLTDGVQPAYMSAVKCLKDLDYIDEKRAQMTLATSHWLELLSLDWKASQVGEQVAMDLQADPSGDTAEQTLRAVFGTKSATTVLKRAASFKQYIVWFHKTCLSTDTYLCPLPLMEEDVWSPTIGGGASQAPYDILSCVEDVIARIGCRGVDSIRAHSMKVTLCVWAARAGFNKDHWAAPSTPVPVAAPETVLQQDDMQCKVEQDLNALCLEDEDSSSEHFANAMPDVDTFLQGALGRPPVIAENNAVRRLAFEDQTLLVASLRQIVDQKEEGAPKRIGTAERETRMAAIRVDLAGIMISDENEPSHALLEKACQIFETNTLRYLEPAVCTSRSQEVQGRTKTKELAFEGGSLIVKDKDDKLVAPTSSELQFLNAMTRRGVSMKFARLMTFEQHTMWTSFLLQALQREPPPGYSKPGLHQLMLSDKAAFTKLEPDVLRLTGPARRQPWRKTVELLPLLQHRLLRHDIVFLGACASSAADATAWRQTVALVTGGRRQGLASSVAQNVALGVAGTWQKGHHMLSGFQGLTLRRDAVSFSVALRRAPWLSTLEHFDATKRQGIPQNVVLASAPLSRPWFGAVLTLQHLERFGPQPDIVAYGSAVSAAGAANWKESLALLQLSTCAGLRHNVVSITAAVVKAWQSANQLLESMRRWLRCDGLSVQRAISASLAAWRNALGLLASSEGDISSINAAMACDGLPWQRCLSLLPFHRADVLSFGSAIAAFAQGYDWVKASWLLRSMSLYGRQPGP
ncbi:unnamed protein product [Cladocopium goreaui]|uniref:Pentatricopeptide repeat-containing protein, chloroplastic n=1 Tax=Cladocopium goreaui TaxID=2562237 RepID=A0A9P1FSI9_9DINO|nr:unnamed protein product [Cladocopium goreaui]